MMVKSTRIKIYSQYNLYLVVWLLFLGFGIYAQILCGDYGDKSLLLNCAFRFLQGKTLYVDIFEVQPPLIIWIYAIPVFLAQMTWIKDSVMLVVCGLPVIFASVYLCGRIIRFSSYSAKDEAKALAFQCFIALLFIFFQNPIYFLDREHLFLVFSLPYMLLFMPSVADKEVPVPLRIITGIFAAPGFCIKPHFVIIFLGLHFINFLYSRSLRASLKIETSVIAVGGITYISCIYLFTPDYITTVMPMLKATYLSYARPLNFLIYLPFTLLCLGMMLADFRFRYDSPYRRDILYFLALLPFFLLYACINNGWAYTWNLLHNMVLILNIFVWWEFAWLRKEYKRKALPWRQFQFGFRANSISLGLNFVFVSLMLLFAANVTIRDYSRDHYALEFMEEIKQLNGGKDPASFGTVSLDFDMASRIARYRNIAWETRFSNLWMLVKLSSSDAESMNKNQWILEYIGNSYASDLDRNKPEIMLVANNTSDKIVGKRLYFLNYLFLNANFTRAWKHYRFLKDIEAIDQREKSGSERKRDSANYQKYSIYKRIQ